MNAEYRDSDHLMKMQRFVTLRTICVNDKGAVVIEGEAVVKVM